MTNGLKPNRPIDRPPNSIEINRPISIDQPPAQLPAQPLNQPPAPSPRTCTARIPSIVTESMAEATELLERGDFNLVKALQSTQQSFIVTDPSLPDNPIVFASQGFLDITGYPMDKVLGRNCRFLQGPDTDPAHVSRGICLGMHAPV